MKIYLVGKLAANRMFISEELPEIIFQTNFDAKLGGRSTRHALQLDRRQNWRVEEDSPDQYVASVFLGKSSNSLALGLRRIAIRASSENDETLVVIDEQRNLWLASGCISVGLLCCILPGLLLIVFNALHGSWNRRIIGKVGAKIKERYPEARLYSY